MMGYRVGLTYDLRDDDGVRPGDPPDANAEFDRRETVEHIAEALEAAGHRVERIGHVRALLDRLGVLAVDVVFNIAEGAGGRNRESQVPILLELAGIPYVGADGLTQGLTLDKVMAKRILLAEGLPTPRFHSVDDASRLNGLPLRYPLIVKPRHEGSSKGLTNASLVKDPKRLRAQAAWVIATYRQPALIEEFIPGTEYTVVVIGNHPPVAQPVVQVVIDGQRELGELFYTFDRITAHAAVEYLCPARIPPALARQLQDLAVRAYQAVDCRDVGRVDLRVDADGHPYILEINPLPSLSLEDVFPAVACARGCPYAQLIQEILAGALARYGLTP